MSIPGGDELKAAVNQIESCWRVSNQYHAGAECKTCEQMVRHADWCPVVNPTTLYAFECIVDPHLMVEADHILLHGLGVTWNAACPKTCKGVTT